MTKPFFSILLLCVIFSANSDAQVTAKFGTELGVSVSALNYIDEDFTAGINVQV